jgi:hypothetical protein
MQAEPRIENGRLVTEADERRPVCLYAGRWRKPDGSTITIKTKPVVRWTPTREELRALLNGTYLATRDHEQD